jgi:hypothetical protein
MLTSKLACSFSLQLMLNVLLLNQNSVLFTAIKPVVASAASALYPAIYGVKTKLSSFSNLSLGSAGSYQKTSKAAPAIFLLTKAIKSASLSTI